MMPRTGRPKKNGQEVYIRLDDEVYRRLIDHVKKKSIGPAKVTKTSIINYAVKIFLDQQDETP